MSSDDARHLEVLLVENNETHVARTLEAMREAGVGVRVVGDGPEALRYLRRGPGWEDAPRPDLILLDMPGPDKRRVLGEIKQSESLRRIPVVVLAAPGAPEDVQETYRMHANCCVSRPEDFAELVRVLRVIGDYWLNVARLPLQDG